MVFVGGVRFGRAFIAPKPSPVPSPPSMQCMQEYCTLVQALILLRGVACQVSRADPFFHVPSSTACWLVRVVGPFVGIAGVLVDPHAGDILPADLVAVRAEEPQLVADDRAAERRVDVPQLLDRVRRRQPCGYQLRRRGCRPGTKLPVPLTKKLPANPLPPCLGMMFICGPPVVASPSPPLRVNTTSCELPTSGT